MSKTKNVPVAKSPTELSRELKIEELLPEINANHRECIKCGNDSIQHAIQAGHLLAKLKKSVKHGEWLPLLESRVDCSPRAATNYIKIAENLPNLMKSQGKEFIADATVGGCIKLIGQSKTDKPEPNRHDHADLNRDDSPRPKPTPAPFVDPVEAACDHDFDDEACRKCHAPKPPIVDSLTAYKAAESQAKKISGGTTFDVAELTSESKDAFGEEAPEVLAKVFELVEGFKEQRSKLTSIKTWLTQNENHPGAAVLSAASQRLRADLDQADSELKFSMPYCVCIYCGNKPPKVTDCNACKGLGWVTEPVYQAAPKGMKREKAKR